MNPSIFSNHSQIGGEVSFSVTIPDRLVEFLLAGSQRVVASFPSGYFLLQEFRDSDFSICHSTILLSEDDSLRIVCEQPVMSLNICLQNSFSLRHGGSSEQLSFHEGQFNMNYSPRLDLIATFQKDRVYSFLSLSYSQEYLSKIAGSFPRLAMFLEQTDQKEEYFLFQANQFATREMKKIIQSMLRSGCKEEETTLCIKKGRALEILIKSLELTVQQATVATPGLTRQDAEKIYQAREWLDQQFNRPVTLFELSRQVGLNVHKLSAGFLQITGTTVFHYHRKIRMLKAIQLLADTDRNLFDIGTEVGYMDDKSFSKEFKKENGITPFEYRKRLKIPHL